MENKTLGVLGGMGPKATSVFFEKVIQNTESNCDQDHIDMIILNHASLPDRTMSILDHQEEAFIKVIGKDIKLLEASGVANIALTCNTAHYFYEQMQALTDVPIINMVDETIKAIYLKYGADSKVGILATNGTRRSGIYKNSCHKYNLEPYFPEPDVQDRVMDIIYNDVKGDLEVGSNNKLEGIIKDLIFEQNCKCVILACTELSCIKLSDDVAKYSIDAMDVLVEKSILLSGKKVKQLLKV
ncbi:aspartate/glutamate racemase family protein [Neobacillus massiliamazoniensis]|uniref:Aspartate racemase n=1 Tax=Neobacillus massiliamazoniensis TaxID=1499688 RepID=A0A0U1NXM5_9BACI|nr:amino acid racemase [Neobacillus massiliamazoniensis]CRK82532.1 aspartate racemase [Neobacillus massiliamazoniensis]